MYSGKTHTVNVMESTNGGVLPYGGGLLVGIHLWWSATYNASGSIRKTSGWDETEMEGSMVAFANHLVKLRRVSFWDCMPGTESDIYIQHFLDNFSGHKDDVAGTMLRNDKQIIHLGIPETSHFLQLGDSKHLNGQFQKLKRSGMQSSGMKITKERAALWVQSFYYHAYSPNNIMMAARDMGFNVSERDYTFTVDKGSINFAL